MSADPFVVTSRGLPGRGRFLRRGRVLRLSDLRLRLVSNLLRHRSLLRMLRLAGVFGQRLRPYLETWRRTEDRHFAADGTAAHADLVVDATVPDPAAGYLRLNGA